MNTNKSKIRERLLHEFQLGHSVTEAGQNVCQALGYEAVKPTCAKKWFRKFREGDTNIEDKNRPGRSKEVDRDAVHEAIEENPSLTTRIHALLEIQQRVKFSRWQYGSTGSRWPTCA